MKQHNEDNQKFPFENSAVTELLMSADNSVINEYLAKLADREQKFNSQLARKEEEKKLLFLLLV